MTSMAEMKDLNTRLKHGKTTGGLAVTMSTTRLIIDTYEFLIDNCTYALDHSLNDNDYITSVVCSIHLSSQRSSGW